MQEEFEAELKASQKAEVKAVADFEALAAAKSKQIETTKAKLDEMEGEFAGNQKAISDAQEDLELTRNQRSADIKFLQNLQTQCNDLDTEWERRSKTRTEEIAAVAEALVILTEDDNREHLAETAPGHKASLASFLQLRSGTEAAARARRVRKAAAILRSAAQDPAFDDDDLLSMWHNRHARPTVGASSAPRAQLSTLAVSVQLDSFTKVKEMMDTMIAELKKEQEEEVKFKAYCRKEIDETEQTTFKKNVQREDLETKIAQLAALMEKLANEIADAQEQIATTKTEILQASQQREKENSEFQTLVADQRATKAILTKALRRLEAFYKKAKGGDFLQKAAQTPPVQFNKYKTNNDASPVIGLIEQIIQDSDQLESEATKGEYSAQANYETMVNDSTALIADLDAAIYSKGKAIAQAKLDTADAQSDLDSTNGELESLGQYDSDLHAQCDFTVKNFDIRQKARMQEMEAIGAAKAILSGDTLK
jgi:chromosome segregation ATPase